MLTQETLRSLFDYDPLTGNLINKTYRCGRSVVGSVVGTITRDGYIEARIDGSIYRVHRLVWVHQKGQILTQCIDHINGKRSDNRIENLRLATRKENNENVKLRADNKSGHRGVHWYEQTNRWRAYVRHHGKPVSVGYFLKLGDAVCAVKQKRDELFTHHKTEHSA